MPFISQSSDPLRPSRFEAPFVWDGRQDSLIADSLKGWMREAVREGEWFLKNQTSYQFIPMSYRLMGDIGFDDLPETLSKASNNFVKRDIRELVESLSNIRPIIAFTSDNREFDDQADILNKCWRAWYTDSMADRDIRKALQYAAVEGTGYLTIEWDPDYWRPGRGDIRLNALGVDSILPIQITPDWDLQKAYAVIIRREWPITWIYSRYPHLRDHLTPDDAPSTSRWKRILTRVMQAVTPTPHNTYGQQRGYRSEDPLAASMITVYDIYILDNTSNMTGRDLIVEEGTPWSYKVPTYGGPTFAGYMDDEGNQVQRPANYWDSRMWPLRRHLTLTNTCVLRDSTNRYWHGKVPVIPFRMDDWPFEYIGVPATKEPAKLQAASTSLLRAKDDSNNARLRPSLQYDRSRVNPEVAESLDARRGGQMVGVSNMLGETFRMLYDPRYYTLDNDTLELIQWMRQQAKELMGLPDLQNLSKAAQIPSGDTVEKLTELAGPLATGIARNMEAALSQVGDMFKGLVFEYYTARRRFHLLGTDGLTREDWDFEPSLLIPALIPGLPPESSKYDRAKAHMANFQFRITPNSVYQQTQSTRKLFMLQLARSGQPISPYTILEMFDVPNPGKPPKGANTEIEKWKAFQKETVALEIEKQTALMQAQMAIQGQMAMQDPLNQLVGMAQGVQGEMGGGVNGKPQEGRPPTGQKPPHIEQKTGGEEGPRTVVSES